MKNDTKHEENNDLLQYIYIIANMSESCARTKETAHIEWRARAAQI